MIRSQGQRGLKERVLEAGSFSDEPGLFQFQALLIQPAPRDLIHSLLSQDDLKPDAHVMLSFLVMHSMDYCRVSALRPS